MGRAIRIFKIPTKHLFTLVTLPIIWKSQIPVSTNMSIVIKPQNFMPIKLNDFTELPKVTIPSCSLQFYTIRSSESIRLVPRWPHISADEPIPIHVPITPQRLAGAGPRSHRLPACTALRDQPETPERQSGWQWEQTGGSRPQTKGGSGNTGGIVSETHSWCHAVAMTLSCVHWQTLAFKTQCIFTLQWNTSSINVSFISMMMQAACIIMLIKDTFIDEFIIKYFLDENLFSYFVINVWYTSNIFFHNNFNTFAHNILNHILCWHKKMLVS